MSFETDSPAEREYEETQKVSVMVANSDTNWAFVETPESVNARMQEQIAALGEVVEDRDQLRAALKAVEWGTRGHCANWKCPGFQHPKRSAANMDQPHAPNCIVGLALKGRE